MATIEVDGKQLEVKDGIMLIEATDAAGIHIPRFCYHPKLSIAANCRMCLVEVERAPKPLPACATPVMNGMKVLTQSKQARAAQKGTLEFLLINHPLDCPICDQGGECPLQDQAVGYGNSGSRFHESKRVVPNQDIGPLIATEMTRCIHCTRCVRFGEEIAGVMEMGAPGRGEHIRIGTFLEQPISSEVSGNIIDLCPVGALTSKPYRFAARSWELQNHAGISPHDCLGSNINIQTLRGRVERVLPRVNEGLNQCWLADRDRYSYQSVNSDQRLLKPMIRTAGEWRETDWESAFRHAIAGLQTIIESSNAQQIGALAGADCTLEEFYLLQKLMRALGSENIDHRLQQSDFRDDEVASPYPAVERPIAELDTLKAALLVGSNLRKEQPLLALRLRQAVKNGAVVSAINQLDYDLNFTLAQQLVLPPNRLAPQLAALAAIIAAKKDAELPSRIKRWCGQDDDTAALKVTAKSLIDAAADGAVFIGAASYSNEDGSVIRAICDWICRTTGNALMLLSPANSVAAHVAGCLPHRGANAEPRQHPGLNNHAMLAQSLRGYLLHGCEPVLDSIDGRAALKALNGADFVVQIAAFKSAEALQYADVLLPLATFAEQAGTYINCEGRVQSAAAAVDPAGEARPGWKILRVLGNFLELDGFNQIQLADVSAEIDLDSGAPSAQLQSWHLSKNSGAAKAPRKGELQCIVEMPMYRGSTTLRHSTALQATTDNPPPTARINPANLDELSLHADSKVRLKNDTGQVELTVTGDARVPQDCVAIIAGNSDMLELGRGAVKVEAI